MQNAASNIRSAIFDLKMFITSLDLRLLLFLILFLNIKMPVKLIAIVLIYTVSPDLRFGFKLRGSRLPLFYLLIIPIALVGAVINKSYMAAHYALVFGSGILCWILSLLVIHQIKLMVDRDSPEAIHKTIIAFFLLNAMVSFGNIAHIMYITHSINPYTFRGMYQTYFINTGDNIMGLTFDISSTNAVLCGLGMIYFLFKNNAPMLLTCAVTLLLTYSNLITLMLLMVLGILFVFKTTQDQKSLLVICLALYGVFMIKISPQNENYIGETIQNIFRQPKPQPDYDTSLIVKPVVIKPDNLLTPEERKRKIAIAYLDSVAAHAGIHNGGKGSKDASVIPKIRPDINVKEKRTREDYLSKAIEPDRQRMLDLIARHSPDSLPLSNRNDLLPRIPGKITGAIQTVQALYHDPAALIAGFGVGNFSSKIAFRASGLGIRGRYPKGWTYIAPAFLSGHLDLYMSFFSRPVAFRSVRNNPFSVYDQLLSEYGLTGLLALLIFYFGFFARRYKALTYGLPMLLFVMGVCLLDYWFEQLSVIVFFELLMFLNIKETTLKTLSDGNK